MKRKFNSISQKQVTIYAVENKKKNSKKSGSGGGGSSGGGGGGGGGIGYVPAPKKPWEDYGFMYNDWSLTTF